VLKFLEIDLQILKASQTDIESCFFKWHERLHKLDHTRVK